MDFRGQQAGDGRRGSNASQSNEYCSDSAIVEQVLTMAASKAWQQLSALEVKLRTLKYNTSQRQSHRWMSPKRRKTREEKKTKKSEGISASRKNRPPAPVGRNEGFQIGSVHDASMPPRNSASEGNGDDPPRDGEHVRIRSPRQQQQPQRFAPGRCASFTSL